MYCLDFKCFNIIIRRADAVEVQGKCHVCVGCMCKLQVMNGPWAIVKISTLHLLIFMYAHIGTYVRYIYIKYKIKMNTKY
jgi:hypothetical protein